MSSTAAQMREYRGVAFLSFGFRPFFLSAALLAACFPLVIALVLAGVIPFSANISVIAWHGHEMLYGYLSAVISGFILTAVPNWTGRLPVLGWRLALLFALWLAGRAAFWLAPTSITATVIDASFLAVMVAIILREIIAGKNWRNLPVCLLLGMFATGNVLWHLDAISGGNSGLGLRCGLATIAVLLALIGGRITPSFTRNWFVKNGFKPFEFSFGLLDKVAIGILGISTVFWLAAPTAFLVGVALVASAILHAIRLARWQGWRTGAEFLVTILHVGYLWLVAALAILGASILSPSLVPQSTAIHALTAGAAGVMTLAVMTRATLGHTGRRLTADGSTKLLYVLVNLGALFRIAAPFFPANYTTIITVSALMWGGAFAIFAFTYGRYLISKKVPATAGATS